MQEAASAARARGARITIHGAQTMAEHEELLRRTGETAPQMMERLGLLGPDLIIGHCIFLDHHSWTRQRTRARSRQTVPIGDDCRALSGHLRALRMTLQTLGGYRRAGVNVGLGTDSYPFNMLEEMREALICSRVAAGSVFDLDTGTLFDIATTGGARALGRDDIGRIAVGAKADLVLVDLDQPTMQPVHDPLRNLIHCAAERAVRDVFIDGQQVVRDHRVLTLDVDGAVRQLQDAQKRACRVAEQSDPQRRPLAKLAPVPLAYAAAHSLIGNTRGLSWSSLRPAQSRCGAAAIASLGRAAATRYRQRCRNGRSRLLHDLPPIDIDIPDGSVVGRVDEAADRLVVGLHIGVAHVDDGEVRLAAAAQPAEIGPADHVGADRRRRHEHVVGGGGGEAARR